MKPKLRHTQILPLNGGFLLKDPLGISSGLFVSRDGLTLALLMDGTRSLLDLKADYLKLTGQLLMDGELKSFLEVLERALLLDNENYQAKLRALKESMLSKGVREMSHGGEVYPTDGNSCRLFLFGEEKKEKLSAIGILVPHMDIRVVKDTYWEAYGRLKDDKKLIVILGVSHYWHEFPFSVLPLRLLQKIPHRDVPPADKGTNLLLILFHFP